MLSLSFTFLLLLHDHFLSFWHWKKPNSESYWTLVRAHNEAYTVVIMVAKKNILAAITATAKLHSADLFWLVHSLVLSGRLEEAGEVWVAQWEQFAIFLASKIDWIRPDLDSALLLQNFDVWSTLPGPVLSDVFFPISPEDMDRTVEASMHDPCPGCLAKEAWARLQSLTCLTVKT